MTEPGTDDPAVDATRQAAGIRNTVLVCLVFVTIVLGGFVWSVVREPPPPSLESLKAEGLYTLPQPRELTPFRLDGTEGTAFTRESLVGHWTLVYFGFTYCGDICPTSMAALAKGYRALQDSGLAADVDVRLVSVDPERDTLELLSDYSAGFHPDFRGARGPVADVATLAQQVNISFGKMPGETPEDYLVEHSGQIVIINPRGHFHGFIRMPHQGERIARAVEALDAHFPG